MGCSYSVPTRVTAAPATTTPSMSATTGIQVGYVTDVEGNVDYDEWVKHSGIPRYSSRRQIRFTNDGAYFVFGGDAMDRCDGGMRFTRRLVAEEAASGRRLSHCGNRDLNKVRFTSELAESDLSRPPSEIPGPHWDPRAPTLEKYLTEIAAEKGVEGGAAAVDNRAERMRHYLKHTLGCPRTFEDRRKELTILGEGGPEPISDDAVVDSLISDIQPGGRLRSYLEHAQLAAISSNTIFVHGALDPTSIKLVPDVKTRFHLPSGPQPMVKHEGVKGWADAFNSLLKEGLKQHLASPNGMRRETEAVRCCSRYRIGRQCGAGALFVRVCRRRLDNLTASGGEACRAEKRSQRLRPRAREWLMVRGMDERSAGCRRCELAAFCGHPANLRRPQAVGRFPRVVLERLHRSRGDLRRHVVCRLQR